MTLVLQGMIEDMQVRNLVPHTQATYILHVSLFARHFGKSPRLRGPEEIRDYQLYLTNQRKLAPSWIVVTTAAVRFLYNVTFKRGWNLEADIPAPEQPKKLPVVLSRAEVLHFLGCVEDIKHQAILTTCYGAGLRISEAVRLTATLRGRDVIARLLLRLMELGAMASSSALASEAVCLNASRILAGGDRGDERQNHNDDPGHRCRLSVQENVGDLGKKAERT